MSLFSGGGMLGGGSLLGGSSLGGTLGGGSGAMSGASPLQHGAGGALVFQAKPAGGASMPKAQQQQDAQRSAVRGRSGHR
jgi:hypothetical protein